MKRWVAVIIVAMIGLAGCAGHYYRIKGDTLYLYVKKTNVQAVYFASSLEDFKLQTARKIGSDTWSVRLPANREFKYFYIADSEVFLPECRFTETDDFGSINCIFVPGM